MPNLNLKPLELNQADLKTYRENGYLITPPLLDQKQIDRLNDEVDRIFTKDYDNDIYPFDRVYDYDLDSPQLRKVNNGWWLNNTIRSVVLSPVLGQMVAGLMGSEGARVWHDQIVVKPSAGSNAKNFSDANIGWHQDYAHWQVSSSMNMCTMWIALQDTDIKNGGMRTVVGSHQWGLLEDAETFHVKNLDTLKDRFAGEREWIDEPCILKAGEASIHHCLSMHGSGPNLTNDPRRCLIIHYMPLGTYYRGRVACAHATYEPGMKGGRHANVPLLGPNAKPGMPFDGECFPMVWPGTH